MLFNIIPSSAYLESVELILLYSNNGRIQKFDFKSHRKIPREQILPEDVFQEQASVMTSQTYFLITCTTWAYKLLLLNMDTVP
jgi:hypothetical protein